MSKLVLSNVPWQRPCNLIDLCCHLQPWVHADAGGLHCYPGPWWHLTRDCYWGLWGPAMARLWIDNCISCCHLGSCRGPDFGLIPEAMLVFEGQIAMWAIQPGRHELWSRVMSGSMALPSLGSVLTSMTQVTIEWMTGLGCKRVPRYSRALPVWAICNAN